MVALHAVCSCSSHHLCQWLIRSPHEVPSYCRYCNEYCINKETKGGFMQWKPQKQSGFDTAHTFQLELYSLVYIIANFTLYHDHKLLLSPPVIQKNFFVVCTTTNSFWLKYILKIQVEKINVQTSKPAENYNNRKLCPLSQTMTNNLQEHSMLGSHDKTNSHLQWVLHGEWCDDKLIFQYRHSNCI